jgi:hypothetical protein
MLQAVSRGISNASMTRFAAPVIYYPYNSVNTLTNQRFGEVYVMPNAELKILAGNGMQLCTLRTYETASHSLLRSKIREALKEPITHALRLLLCIFLTEFSLRDNDYFRWASCRFHASRADCISGRIVATMTRHNVRDR